MTESKMDKTKIKEGYNTDENFRKFVDEWNNLDNETLVFKVNNEMLILDKFNEIEAFGASKTLNEALSFGYSLRIYVHDTLDEDIPEDLLQATEQFLNIYPTKGDELDYWKLFLTINFNDLNK